MSKKGNVDLSLCMPWVFVKERLLDKRDARDMALFDLENYFKEARAILIRYQELKEENESSKE